MGRRIESIGSPPVDLLTIYSRNTKSSCPPPISMERLLPLWRPPLERRPRGIDRLVRQFIGEDTNGRRRLERKFPANVEGEFHEECCPSLRRRLNFADIQPFSPVLE